MHFNALDRRRAGIGSLAVAAVGAASVALHPALAFAAIGAVESAVTCATSAACVAGNNTSSGSGVTGTSKKGVAITAVGVTGILANGTSGPGLGATSASGPGVTGSSNSSVGVRGTSNGNYGVVGSSNTAIGVFGNGPYGVYGTSSSGSGVFGSASGSATGVYGYSPAGDAIFGFSPNYAVEGETTGGLGLYGLATSSGTAVYASSSSGFGIQAYSNGNDAIVARSSGSNGADIEGSYIGIEGRAPASGGFPLNLTDENANDLMWVTGGGDLYYTGSIYHYARVSRSTAVKSYSPTTTLPTVEDFGTAQLVGGVATVRIDSAFAASIDSSTAYRVFLTPDGDTRGLFVATKTPAGFVVRETQGGRSTLSFDYRIVATAAGHAGQRMAFAAADLAAPHSPRIVTAPPTSASIPALRNPPAP